MSVKERIMVEDPDVLSQAAAVLLRRKLMVADNSSRMHWLRWRSELLTQWLTERGDLVCHYCGRPGLVIEDFSVSRVATLDHVIPVSRGGPRYDANNLVVACNRCNQKKSDKDYELFRSLDIGSSSR